MFALRSLVHIAGLLVLMSSPSDVTSSTISHTVSISPGSVVMVNGSFTYSSGSTPSVKVDFGTYSGGVFSPFNPANFRNGNLAIGFSNTGTFSINPGYGGTVAVQVAFRSTLYETTFLGMNKNVANTVGTITP